jgi:hypothetical protein
MQFFGRLQRIAARRWWRLNPSFEVLIFDMLPSLWNLQVPDSRGPQIGEKLYRAARVDLVLSVGVRFFPDCDFRDGATSTFALT